MSAALVPEERYVRRDEWDEIRSFVGGASRPPLVGTLLAGAEALIVAACQATHESTCPV